MVYKNIRDITHILKIANNNLDLIDSIIISRVIATLCDILDDNELVCNENEKIKDNCNYLWENKYEKIYSQLHSKIYFPVYKYCCINDYDCSGWNLYVSQNLKTKKFNYVNDLDEYIKYILKIKVKIIILSVHIDQYNDYHNEYSINEFIDIKNKYVNECVVQENNYQKSIHTEIFKKQNFEVGGVNFDGDEIDIFVDKSQDYLYYCGKKK